jgi:hypothetical protein
MEELVSFDEQIYSPEGDPLRAVYQLTTDHFRSTVTPGASGGSTAIKSFNPWRRQTYRGARFQSFIGAWILFEKLVLVQSSDARRKPVTANGDPWVRRWAVIFRKDIKNAERKVVTMFRKTSEMCLSL